MACDFRMHSALFCGAHFDEWLAGIGASFVPTMLPPHGQAKFANYANRLGETGLFICQRCIDNIGKKISLAPAGFTIVTCTTTKDISASSLSNEDDNNDVEVEVIATSMKQQKKKQSVTTKTPRQPKKVFDWKIFTATDWEKIEVSVEESNILQAGSEEKSRLRGVRVDGELVPIVDINLDELKTLTSKTRFHIPKSRRMNKKLLCEKLVAFRGEQEKKAAAPTTTAADASNLATPPFNDYRLLNVMFSGAFIIRFASRARSLKKHDFDQGLAADQQLHTDLLVEYNKDDVVAYGTHAHANVTQKVDPKVFQQIPTTQWKRAEERCKQLYANYEKSLLIWTESGTNCDYEELKNLEVTEAGNRHVCVYMHYFVREHRELLQLCTATLPTNAFRDSTYQRRTPISPVKRGRKRGSRGERGDKENSAAAAASNQYRDDAMISISEKNGSIADKEKESKVNVVVDRVSNVGAEMRAVAHDRSAKMDKFVAHCGNDKKVAKERIAKMQRKRREDDVDNGDKTNSDDDDCCSDEPDSQETIIGEILDREEALRDLKEIYNSSMKKAKEFSSDGGNA
jgi:hypothetical protein